MYENYIMTIFYSKTSGFIRGYTVSEIEQDFGYFGEFAEESKLIFDKTVIKYNAEFDKNWKDYKIDLETKLPVLKEQVENNGFELVD